MKKVLVVLAALAALAAVALVAAIGPRNAIGMIRYDQRREGELKVGDRAPDGRLVALDGKSRRPLLARGKPTVLAESGSGRLSRRPPALSSYLSCRDWV